MGRELTEAEKEEYERLTAQVEQLTLQMDAITNKPTVYGYSRVASKGQAKDGNSLEVQERDLKEAGAEILYDPEPKEERRRLRFASVGAKRTSTGCSAPFGNHPAFSSPIVRTT